MKIDKDKAYGAVLGCLLALTTAPSDCSAQTSAFRLVGTVEGGPFTGAVLDDAKGEQAFHRLHEKLADGSQIVNVKSDHIVLKWPDGALTELYASPGAAGAPSGAPQARVVPPPREEMARQVLPRPEAAPAAPPDARAGTNGPDKDRAAKRALRRRDRSYGSEEN